MVPFVATAVAIAVTMTLRRPDADAQGVLDRLRTLTVAAEHRCSPYDRDDYRYLRAVERQVVDRMGGRIYSPYSGKYFSTTEETQIEHIVALSEAHNSGLCSASASARRSLATDLDNLTLASPRLNRSKSAKDAGDWLPPFAANRCWFAARVVLVRDKHGLTIDSEERDTLQKILGSCTDTAMVIAPVLTR